MHRNIALQKAGHYTIYHVLTYPLLQIDWLMKQGFFQKLLSGMENLMLLKADRGLLTRKLVSMSKANRQILQLRLMGHQRQITLSSIRLIRSRSMLLGLSSNATLPGATYEEDRFNRLIAMLRLNQGRLARDILLHLLQTLQVFQGLQNYDRYVSCYTPAP